MKEEKEKPDPISEILDLIREDSLMSEETSDENRHRAYAAIYIHTGLADLKDTEKFLEKSDERNKRCMIKGIICELEVIMGELIEKSGYITLKNKLTKIK